MSRRAAAGVWRRLGACLLWAALLSGCFFPGVHPLEEPPADVGEWPQYRSEPSHLGVAPDGTSVGRTMVLLWKSERLGIGDYTASRGSPAVDEDLVYIGADDGRLHALDRDTGELVWSFATRSHEEELQRTDSRHRGIQGSPAVDEAAVYIGDYTGRLYAVDRCSGEEIWERHLGHSIGASPVRYGGYVFIAVEYGYPDGRVFVLDAADGRTAYRTAFLGNHPHSSVTVDAERGLMFVGANNGLFFCFDFLNGVELWRVQTDGAIKSTAAVAGDTVYITSWSRRLHAYAVEDGRQLFTVTTESYSMSSPSVYEGRVYFGSHDDRLYCVDAVTGETLWTHATGGNVQSSPTVVPETGVVIFGSRDNWLRSLELSSGESVWSVVLDDDVTSVPVAVGDRLYVNDDSGTLWCFACASGQNRR